MWANRVLDALITVLAWVVLPVQLVTTFLLGLLVQLTFGLLLIPFSLVWMVLFLGPLLGLSWLWGKATLLRVPVAGLGIPLALLANTYTCLIPSMGEMESRLSKILLCQTWPFTVQSWALVTGRTTPDSEAVAEFNAVLVRLARKDLAIRHYLLSLGGV